VGEPFFRYWLTRVVPEKIQRAVKWFCVCVCVPRLAASQDEKEEFYEQLSLAINAVAFKD